MDVWEIFYCRQQHQIIPQPSHQIVQQAFTYVPAPLPIASFLEVRPAVQPCFSFIQYQQSAPVYTGVTAQGAESSSQLSSDEDKDEDDDEEESRESRDEISNLLGAEGPDLSISEHLQEINQEDLAAILPDVGGGSFDGFEEENNGGATASGCTSSNRPQASSPAPSHITSSSSSDSDTEQIVSDVISRMQDDSESQPSKPTRASVPATRSAANDQSDCAEVGYSSNLLADFVEKTELLSRSSSSNASGSRAHESSSNAQNAPELSSKRKRGRPPKSVKGAASSCRNQHQVNGMPELEAYMRLDCSQSNVSPDSGIQSVAGSPAGHHSLPGSPRSPPTVQNSGPPLLTKAHSPDHLQDTVPSPNEKLTKLISPSKELKLENGGKRGPGRPKSHGFVLNTFGRKKRGKRLKRKVEIPKKPIVLPPSAAELKVPPFIAGTKQGKSNLLPNLPLPHASSKRRRGRPKKSPPVLEPNLPLEVRRRDNSNGSRRCSSLDGSIRNDPNKRKSSFNVKSSPHSMSCLSKTKEHKHKKRKRQLLDFRRLEPAFLQELTLLSDIFEKCCFISCSKSRSRVANTIRKSNKISQRQRKRRDKATKNVPEIEPEITPPPVKIQSETKTKVFKENISNKNASQNSIDGGTIDKIKVPEKKKASKVESITKEKKEENKVVFDSDAETLKTGTKMKKDVNTISELPKIKEDRTSEVNREKIKERHKKEKNNSTEGQLVKQSIDETKTEPSTVLDHQETKDPSPSRKGPAIKSSSPSRKDKVPSSVKDKDKISVAFKDKSTAPPKEKTSMVSNKKENLDETKEKSASTQLNKEKPSDYVSKDRPIDAPCKDKPTSGPVTKEKPDTIRVSDVIHPIPETVSKEKPSVIQMAREKTITNATKEKAALTVAATKEKTNASSSHREKTAFSTKEKSSTSVVHKDKKENVHTAVQKDKPMLSNGPVTSPQTSAKRRIKKSIVEPPKNKDKLDQTNSNEQRLPLKKRHYHMSSNLSSSDMADKSDESSDSSREVTETREESLQYNCKLSIEEHDLKNADDKVITTQESVIVTPKKRPCLEAEKKSSSLVIVKTKDKEASGKDGGGAKRTALKVGSGTPGSGQSKRTSSRQAALKQSEAPETNKTPSSPSVKRSQRIRLKNDEEKLHKDEQKIKLKNEHKSVKEEKKLKDEPNFIKDDFNVVKEEVEAIKEEPKSVKDDPKIKNVTKSCKVESKPCTMQNTVSSSEDEKKDVLKRTTRSMDEVAELKINEIMKNESLKNSLSDKIESLRHLSPISTRSSSKTSLESIAGALVDSAFTRAGRSKGDRNNKSLVGIFEPSSTKAADILKFPDPHCDVLNKIKNKLLPPDQDIDVEEELKNIKRPIDTSAVSNGNSLERIKKRKVICNVRVHVTKLDPDDIFLKGGKLANSDDSIINGDDNIENDPLDSTKPVPVNNKRKTIDIPEDLLDPSTLLTECEARPSNDLNRNAKDDSQTTLPNDKGQTVLTEGNKQHDKAQPQNKIKIKRKKINRTGFPVKKKKKKRVELPDTNDRSFTTEELEPCTDVPIAEEVPIVVEATPQLKKLATPMEAPPASMTPPATPTPSVSTDDVSKGSVEMKMESVGEKPNQTPIDKTELRPASKRIMELKAKNEASERRKRKISTPKISSGQDGQDATPKESDGATDGLMDLKSLVGKRPRKTKEDHYDSDMDSVKIRKKQPRWKKKYLPAGLFSDYFKEDEPRKLTSTEKVKSTFYNKLDHEHGLLPPPSYCAKWVRQRRIPFQLPHDIWWLHVHNQLPGREEVPSWNYKKIRTNVYFDVKPSYSYEAQACNCKPVAEMGCGEECINRMVLAECSPQLCPCKERCSNQKIQRHEWAPGLVKFMTKDKGWGVKTKHKIRKDSFILEYVGEVVSDREFKGRMASRYLNDTHHYCLNLDSGLLIDGHRMGGDGRFVNHSCEPNCEMQKWCVNGLFRMALFALRDIDPNEELTYDYNFSLFNPTEGQQCKCGSLKCRGVIGGKSQRVALPSAQNSSEEVKLPGQVGRPRKSLGNAASIGHRRKTNSVDKRSAKMTKDQKASGKDILNASALATVAARLSHMTALRPLTPEQKEFIVLNRIFLTRNLQKVKRRVEKLREAVKKGGLLLPEVAIPAALAPASPAAVSSISAVCSAGMSGVPPTNILKEKEGEREVFMTQLNALNCPRSMKTRRLALAEDNPEMTKIAHLACLFKDLYSEVTSAKDESGELLSSHFTTLPSKRKFPLYYQRIQKPIDFTGIEQNIVTGVYKTVETFNDDMNALFKNNIRWYGRTSDLGIAATRLRKIYNLAKLNILAKLEEVLGEPPPSSFIPAQDDPSGEEEDVIHCICGIFRDEGMMIQCERCLVWQHCYCVGANGNVENYLCERCSPREVDYEIPSQEEATAPNQTNYITLLRGDMQLKQGDTVYVLRDIVNEESTDEPKAKHTYKTIKNWKYSDCDIFKIERLWKDDNGSRFAFGHHYLRPHETFHEPTRKFFPNELMRVPLYEVVPIELVMGQCYVLDLSTYCKGRPIGCDPDHLYVCEYRVDKCARMFAKIPKPKHSNVCTKSYAFETFDVRLKPQRTYAPHGMPKDEKQPEPSSNNGNTSKQNVSRGRGGRTAQLHSDDVSTNQASTSSLTSRSGKPKPKQVLKREDRKDRLNKLMLKLLSKLPSKQTPLDLSYLLEPGRRQRKKPPLLAS